MRCGVAGLNFALEGAHGRLRGCRPEAKVAASKYAVFESAWGVEVYL